METDIFWLLAMIIFIAGFSLIVWIV